jgi:uncharacterized membrane protein
VDWVFLALGGFLLGSTFFAGYYATRSEPQLKPGYLIIGVGLLVNVGVSSWMEHANVADTWIRATVLVSYAVGTAGLVWITYIRRRNQRWGRKEEDGP